MSILYFWSVWCVCRSVDFEMVEFRVEILMGWIECVGEKRKFDECNERFFKNSIKKEIFFDIQNFLRKRPKLIEIDRKWPKIIWSDLWKIIGISSKNGQIFLWSNSNTEYWMLSPRKCPLNTFHVNKWMLSNAASFDLFVSQYESWCKNAQFWP